MKTQCVFVKTQCVFKSVFIFPLIYVPLENISARPPIYVLFSKYEDSFVFLEIQPPHHPTNKPPHHRTATILNRINASSAPKTSIAFILNPPLTS